MKQKYIGASPLVDVLFIPFTGRFTSGYQDLIRSGFFNPPCFYVDPSSTHFRIEGEVVLSSPPQSLRFIGDYANSTLRVLPFLINFLIC